MLEKRFVDVTLMIIQWRTLDTGNRKRETPVQVSLFSHSPKKGSNAEKLEENFLEYYNFDKNLFDLERSLPNQ